ncbi:MAG: DUF6067 family protein, partial [Planctomycetota bacterium]|nr:DUF6067 family protein [Planctomycetota bacterium]
PHEGRLQARWQIRNPTDKPVEVALLSQVMVMDRKAKEGGDEIFKLEKTVTVAPGETATVPMAADYQGKINDQQKGGLFFLATVKESVLYRHFHYFLPDFPAISRQPAEPAKTAFPLALVFNPVTNTVEIKTDAYYLDNPDAARAVKWEIAPKGGAALRTGIIEQAVHYFRTARVAIPDLKPGEYEVKAVMLMADGKELGPVTAAFTKLDEAREFAAWWQTKLGNDERVIYPFTAIKVENGAISPWGRSYRLNSLGLPPQIISQGKPITAGNGRVVIVTGGKEIALPLDKAAALTEQKDWRVRFQGAAEGNGLFFKAQGWVEQDGLVYVELTYGPQAEPVQIDALRLEYPISGLEGETFLCLGTGGNYSARTTMILPSAKEKQG